jgi:curved DNA-binding protein CbpA
LASTPDDRTGVPRPVPSFDAGKLVIGALERFVLSNIDGKRTEHELADLTGLADRELAPILDKLAKLGAVQRDGSLGSSSGQKAAAPIPDDQVELEDAMKMRVLDLSTRLDDLDHYELLGIPRDADKRAIKSAYYGIAARFHTDRYFGKNLGRFKPLMEQIFGRATVAHEALSKASRKAEYDEYLQERDRTQAYERLLAAVDDGGDFFTAERASGRVAAASPITELGGATARDADVATVRIEPSIPAAPFAPPVPAVASPSQPLAPAAPLTPEQERARREALARRLAGSRGGTLQTGRMKPITMPGASVAPKPATGPTQDEVRAAQDNIKRAYEDRRDGAKRAQAAKFVEAGAAALAKDDVVAAATHYRLAVKYTDDPAVHATYADVNRRARDLLCDAYLKQARYEEQQQKWHEAAISYVKALEGRPEDADIAERAAAMLLREGRDLRRAGKYAELAVQKNPNAAAFRVTLASVYLGAGLFLRAKSELEQALKLSPEDAKVKELLAHAKKMVS